jgi:molybdopterin-biosynthesis enzyme MoeA-like protein
MTISLLVIGDELLSGKRQDGHLRKVAQMLAARGMELREARFLGDDEDCIAAAVVELRARGDLILSCGGIGATPDDVTRQAVARALGVTIQRHPAAEALILAQYREHARPNRVLMADFPAGAKIIPNPVNNVAGFSCGGVYCVPGFPDMAHPMLEWVLDHELTAMHRSDAPVEYSLRVYGSSGEGDLLGLMEEVLRRYPAVKLSSLPHLGDAQRAPHIEFGIRGPGEAAAPAFRFLQAALELLPDVRIEILRAP